MSNTTNDQTVEVNVINRNELTLPSPVPKNTHFDALKTCVRKLTRTIIVHQFCIEESMKEDTEYLFTMQHVREIENIKSIVRNASEFEDNFETEIERNLSILIDEQHHYKYEEQWRQYIKEVDRLGEKIHRLEETIEIIYGNLDNTRMHSGEGRQLVYVGTQIYENSTTPIQLAAAVVMSLYSVWELYGILDTKWTICNYIKSLREDFWPKHYVRLQLEALESTSFDQEPQPIEPSIDLQWKGSKTDLAELIWALSKWGYIINSTTGQRVRVDELTRKFETLFGQSISTMGLMQGRKRSFKAANDGLTFTSMLSELVDRYVSDQ